MTDPKPTSRRVGRRNGGSPREMAGTRTAGAVQLEVGHRLALNSRREQEQPLQLNWYLSDDVTAPNRVQVEKVG
ncbi:hypothetical protein GW17_00003652 [Ensete ventricosum]|nr:hypothetical protein GW17_00003652 [Ensete ventricosum]